MGVVPCCMSISFEVLLTPYVILVTLLTSVLVSFPSCEMISLHLKYRTSK